MGRPRSSGPAAAPPPTISIPTASGAIVDYDVHYRRHNVSPAQLWVDISFLRQAKRMVEVEQALKAYLKHQGKRSEAWMYLLLAVALEVNGRPTEDVRTALGWAGYLARRQGDPYTLIEVADILLLRDQNEIALPGKFPPVRTGELLDTAAEKAPHRAEPILLSLILAERTLDPQRMGDASERLLSLGWPGVDEQWRIELRKRVEALAKRLEDAGRHEDAGGLLERLDTAATRDLFVRLTWKGNAGLELEVEEPLGAKATVDEPRTVFGGAIVKNGYGKWAESAYTCPRGFDGEYRIHIKPWYNDEKDPARDIQLEVITHEGTPEERRTVHPIELPRTGPIVVLLKNGRRKQVLPFQSTTRIKFGIDEQASHEAMQEPIAPPTSSRAAAEAAEALGGSQGKPGRESPPAIKTDEKPSRSQRRH